MLELPFDDLTDLLRLADWLELCAILSQDHNSSRGDLESVLRVASLVELGDDEAIERKTLDVFDELGQRANAAGEAYPFDVNYTGELALKSNWDDFSPYIFCLCLSYFGLSETHVAPKLFEKVSCLAAENYLQGNAIEFGWPRKELPSSFPDAITAVCALIGEGEGYRAQLSLDCKDDTLDLVAWKDFADKRPNKILMFGQCGAGKNWADKLGELQPGVFWNQWMQKPPVSPSPMKAFFTPYRVEREKWEFYARKAGVLFDRCRIAFWAHQVETDYNFLIAWIKNLIA